MDSTLWPNIVAFLHTIPPFDRLPEESLDTITAKAEILFLGKGEPLALCGSQTRYLYIVRSGSVEQRLPDGSLRARLGEADLFGFGLEQERYQVNALENSLLYRLEYDSLIHCVAGFPDVARQFALNANQRLLSGAENNPSQNDKTVFFQTVGTIATNGHG